MNREYTRAPHRRAPGVAVADEYSPHAALLIDFDNVTMAIRSNLGEEVRQLLDSDMIRGKVSVQRAYADWRRYPQYVLPLSEASIDLIYAPAYGSSKKNATDIRLAIDALELVFTRPEIGTFILLSGDSDFSSLVLKLKEYGKYVIGVGLQESSSDILVQNCDEYYSYNTISGLTSAVDAQTDKLDPWELTDRALERMVERSDVMRSDRLKQVMLEMDSGFDEKSQGFSKFNKFLAEAARQELVTLRKSENGQYEVAPGARSRVARDPAAGARPRLSQEAEASGPRRRGRSGRGREERGREERAPRRSREEPDGGAGRAADAAAARRDRSDASRSGDPSSEAASDGAGASEPAASRPSTSALRRAYDLLRGAIRSLAQGSEPVRDSEVKRQILAEDGAFDEAALGFRKFSRFLQQAHDEGVIDLTQGEDGNYYLSVPGENGARGDGRANGGRQKAEETARRPPRSGTRGRGAGRREAAEPAPRGEAEVESGEVLTEESEAEAAASSAAAAAAEAREASSRGPTEAPVAGPAARQARGRSGLGRFRRGSRGADPAASAAAPAIGPVDVKAEADTGGRTEVPAGSEAEAAREEPARPEARAGAEAPAPSEAEARTEQESETRRDPGGRDTRRQGLGRFRRGSRAGGATAGASPGSRPAASRSPGEPRSEAGRSESGHGEGGRSEAAGGQTGGDEAAAAVDHMVRNYSGVGQRTAERLVEEFGERVFEVIDREPQRVTDLLSEHRARAVLEAREAERETGSARNG